MPRERDVVWDTLVELYGDVSNDNERGRRNKAVKLLKQSEATPDEIRKRYLRYADVMGDATNTPLALANNWSRLAPNEESGVAQVFRAIWPNGKFTEAGWRTVLQGFKPSEIIDALQQLGYSREYPPGAIEVKKLIIQNRLGGEAPLEPQAALSVARTHIDAVNAYTSNTVDLPDMVLEAMKITKDRARVFDEKVFLDIYRGLLANFYQTYGSS